MARLLEHIMAGGELADGLAEFLHVFFNLRHRGDFPTQSLAGDYKEIPAIMYGFIRMLAKAAVWAALVRLFNWLMDEFLS